MKMKAKLLIALAVNLVLMAVLVVPQIIEAKRSKGSSTDKFLSVPPEIKGKTGQGQSGNVSVGNSVHNDTSAPLSARPTPVGAMEKGAIVEAVKRSPPEAGLKIESIPGVTRLTMGAASLNAAESSVQFPKSTSLKLLIHHRTLSFCSGEAAANVSV